MEGYNQTRRLTSELLIYKPRIETVVKINSLLCNFDLSEVHSKYQRPFLIKCHIYTMIDIILTSFGIQFNNPAEILDAYFNTLQ